MWSWEKEETKGRRLQTQDCESLPEKKWWKRFISDSWLNCPLRQRETTVEFMCVCLFTVRIRAVTSLSRRLYTCLPIKPLQVLETRGVSLRRHECSLLNQTESGSKRKASRLAATFARRSGSLAAQESCWATTSSILVVSFVMSMLIVLILSKATQSLQWGILGLSLGRGCKNVLNLNKRMHFYCFLYFFTCINVKTKNLSVKILRLKNINSKPT